MAVTTLLYMYCWCSFFTSDTVFWQCK